MGPLPPLNLSSGPAISGSAPNTSGGSTTGAIYWNKKRGWQERALAALPLVLIGGVIWWTMRRK